MTDQITTPVGGSDKGPVVAVKLLDIHDWWYGADARDEDTTIAGSEGRLSDLLSGTSFVALDCGETRLTYLPKLNLLNAPNDLILAASFASAEEGTFPGNPSEVFTDTAGTTPATFGNSVALMLDKSKGLALGPELVANGDFEGGLSSWISIDSGDSTTTVSSGVATFACAANGDRASIRQSVPVSENRIYEIEAQILSSNSEFQFRVGTAVTGIQFADERTSEVGLLRFRVFSGNNTFLGLNPRVVSVGEVSVGYISVRELKGNHAVQSSAALRPLLGRAPVDAAPGGAIDQGSGPAFIRFDLSDDVLPTAFPDGGTFDVMLFGRQGSWIERGVTIAPAGSLDIGPTTITDGPAGLLAALGDIVGWTAVDRTLSEAEVSRLVKYHKARGAGDLLESIE